MKKVLDLRMSGARKKSYVKRSDRSDRLKKTGGSVSGQITNGLN